jgi:integrase/recombinase XerC
MHMEIFLAYLKHEKRYSDHTVISYRNDLEQFYYYIKKAFDIENISEASHLYIRSWMAQMSEDDMGARSINRKISALRSYCKFLMKRGLLEKDPTIKIQPPKTSKRLPVYVEQQDIGKLFDQVEFEDSFNGRRDRMVLELLYNTGMRRAELLNLKDSDVDTARRYIKVLGKGNKERLIPVSQQMADSLDAYIKEKRTIHGGGWLMVTDKGAKLYPEMAYRIVKKFLSLVTTIEKRSPHVLRHTFATHLTNNGAEINAVKDLLGHASLAATQVYTHNNIEQLKDIYKNTHPKA